MPSASGNRPGWFSALWSQRWFPALAAAAVIIGTLTGAGVIPVPVTVALAAIFTVFNSVRNGLIRRNHRRAFEARYKILRRDGSEAD